MVYSMLRLAREFLFPKNRTFARQIGVNSLRRQMVRLLLSRLRHRPVFLQPHGTTDPAARYEVRRWDPNGTELFLADGLADWGIERLFVLLAKPGGGFVDVGSHTGYFAHLFYEKASHFLLVEPSDRCVRECLHPLVDRWRTKTVVVCHSPAYSQSGIDVEIRQSGDGWGMSPDLNGEEQHVGDSQRTMRTVTVDEVCSSHESLAGVPIHAIKIDVDGPDLAVLEGAANVIHTHRPLVLIENCDEPLLQFAEKESYQLFAFAANRDRPWEMTFTHLADSSRLVGLWAKMTLAVPAEHAALLVALDGCTRDNRDRKHLFREF
jgi:FkbM family methyltransferase